MNYMFLSTRIMPMVQKALLGLSLFPSNPDDSSFFLSADSFTISCCIFCGLNKYSIGYGGFMLNVFARHTIQSPIRTFCYQYMTKFIVFACLSNLIVMLDPSFHGFCKCYRFVCLLHLQILSIKIYNCGLHAHSQPIPFSA